MLYYDHNLNLLPTYTSIDWGPTGSFGPIGKNSQLILFLSKVMPPNKKICIFEHKSQLFDTATIHAINQSNMDYIVINVSDHPSEHPHSMPSAALIKKPCIVLTHNFNDMIKGCYHPWHLLFSHTLAKQDIIDFTTQRKNLVSCVHSKSRVTRIVNIAMLSKKSYFNKIYVNWLDKPRLKFDIFFEDDLTTADIEEYFDDYIKIQNLNPIDTIPFGSEFDGYANLERGFTDTYLNIVTEARCANFGFLTEKIYKPIRAGQLFLVQAAPNSIQFLNSMGIDTFTDYINHNHYDSEPNWKIRTILMQEVLDDIFPNIEEIFFKTTSRRENNKKRLASVDLMTECLSSIVLQLDNITMHK